MGFKILVASPDRSLGEQIAQKLREANISPLLASSVAEAAFIVQDEKCMIAVLDCQLPDPGADYLAENLHAYFDDLNIIFIHSEDEGAESIKPNQARDLYLPSPFFIPDLLEVINLWVAEKKSSKNNSLKTSKVQEMPAGLAWLQDVNKAAQYLTRLSLEIDARVALIIRDDKIWAYAGQLSKLATEELAQYVGHHWANSDGSDLARFVRLASTDCEYMLYATHLGSGFVLTLCFMSEMPFTKIRSQTAELARRLTDLPLEPTKNYLHAHKQKEILTAGGETDGGDDQRRLTIEAESDLTCDAVGAANHENHGELQQGTLEEQFPNDHYIISEKKQMTSPDQKSYAEISLDSGSFDQHDLSYSCVLLPRLPDHNLSEGIIDLLKNEISRFCLAFGWRLEQLNIQPEFLHWVVGVTPDVAALTVIQHVREQTSAVLFAERPRFSKENPSGDFWAPGFLVIGGRQPLTESMVRKYIQNTRSRQGIDQDYNQDNNA